MKIFITFLFSQHLVYSHDSVELTYPVTVESKIDTTYNECVHEWRGYAGDSDPEKFGFNAGLFKPGIQSYIGRGISDSKFKPGRIQLLEPKGFYYAAEWTVHRMEAGAEYLVYNSSQIYNWIDSSDGKFVEYAVIAGFIAGRDIYYIARVNLDGFSFIGFVTRDYALAHYENGKDQESTSKKYQILTCRIDYASKMRKIF